MSTSTLWRQAIKEAFVLAPADTVILHTLELIHPAMDPAVRMVQNIEGGTFTLETEEEFYFEPAAFRFSLPPSGTNGIQELMLQLDNTDRRISDYLEAVLLNPEPITVKYRAFLSSDLTTPQTESPLVLFLSDLHVTASEVSGRASFADIVNRQFLSVPYSVRNFPGLA